MALTLPAEQVIFRNNVRVSGRAGARALVFVHGFATDQRMWRLFAARLAPEYRIVLLDLVGAGESDASAYDPMRYRDGNGYAMDLVEIAEALDLQDAVIIGHSFGAIVGLLAHIAAPERFGPLVLLGPSARYVDDPETGYRGGLSATAVEDLLETLESNFQGWSNAMAPAIMANPERPQLAQDLADTFCSTDPGIAALWARATFLTDIRDVLDAVTAPVWVLQCRQDPIVPVHAGRWLADRLPRGEFVQLAATGHCPHLSAPDETLGAICRFLDAHTR